MPQVSVIVPAYNVEPYIRQCLDSLVNQTLADIEIIVIDDGSADGTPGIIAEYAAKHASIRSIQQENQGLGAVRNAGIAAAKGDYIGFVDGDDWVDHDMYQLLYQQAVSQQCDLVICNGSRFDQLTGKVGIYWSQEEWRDALRLSGSAPFRAIHNPPVFVIEPVIPNRLIRRTLLERIRFKFPVGLIYEDMPSHFEILLAAEAISLLDRRLYYYRVNRPGQITSWRDDRVLHVLGMFEKIDQVLVTASPPLEIWAAAMRFQFRNVSGIHRYLDATVGRRLIEGWLATLRHVPTAAIDSFRRHYPLDRFALYCIQTGRLDWLTHYEMGKPTNEIRQFLLLHPSMWPVILHSVGNKTVAIRRRLFGAKPPRD